MTDDPVGLSEQLLRKIPGDVAKLLVHIGDLSMPVRFRNDIAGIDRFFVFFEQMVVFNPIVHLRIRRSKKSTIQCQYKHQVLYER